MKELAKQTQQGKFVVKAGSLTMGDEADWFRFQLGATAPANAEVTMTFQNSLGELDLALYDSGGTRLPGSSAREPHFTKTVRLGWFAAGALSLRQPVGECPKNPKCILGRPKSGQFFEASENQRARTGPHRTRPDIGWGPPKY